jgi:DNA-directed RNA polymerase specialized sigma24 family protein
VNRIRNEIRRIASRPATAAISGNEPHPGASPLDEVIALEILDRYAHALTRLRDEERHAIHLRVDLGCDYAKIADAMGKSSPDAARMAVTRALKSLQREMERVRART